jgi:hypothetical protein
MSTNTARNIKIASEGRLGVRRLDAAFSASSPPPGAPNRKGIRYAPGSATNLESHFRLHSKTIANIIKLLFL